jgi:uncharacterized protein (DUF362 family)
MQRREFLIQVARASAAAITVSGAGVWLAGRQIKKSESLYHIPDYSVPSALLTRDFVVARGDDPRAMIKAALKSMGGIEKFIKPEERVLVKPNAGFDRPPILGATTSPQVIAAVVELCVAAGAGEVIVSDNPINSPEASFARTGIAMATEQSGGKVRYLTDRDFRETAVDGVAIGNFPVTAGILEDVDRVIGVPTLKDHNLSGMSFAMKNWYGLLGEGRNRFHQDIHNVIADLAHMIKPTLVIGDATRILMRHGPTGGSPTDVKPGGTVIVSTDAVAVDALGIELLGRTIRDCPSITLAAERGIGAADPQTLRYDEVVI